MLRIAALIALVCVATAQLLYSPPTYTVDDTEETGPSTTGHGPFTPTDPERRRHYREASEPENVDLVIVGITSGSHNPDVFLRDDPSTGRWGEEGISQLNTVGKREAWNLGRALRQRYGNMITQQFYPTNYMSFSSTGESEQMTCQVVNTGMFPPMGKSVIDPSIRWQPIPVTTDDTLLGISRMTRCPALAEVMEPIMTGEIPVVQNVLNREREIVDYVVRSTGIRNNNLEDLSEIAENLYQLKVRQLPFPDWAERPSMTGMNKETFYRRVQVFRHAVEVACSVHEPCKRLFSGVVMNQMKEIIETVTKTKDTTTTQERKERLGMVVYTGDVEVILSVLRVLDLDYYNVPTTGGFILEIRTTDRTRTTTRTTTTTTPSIRVIYHEPDMTNPQTHKFYSVERVPGTGRKWDCPEDFCAVEEFVRHIRSYVITDSRVACHDTDCNVNQRNINKMTNMFPNTKTTPKGVDCTYVTDKYPETACRELARNNFCTQNNFIRNVVCRRTCNCTQFDTMDITDYIN